MRLYIAFLIIFSLNIIKSKAQASEKNVVKTDTISETVVYEYDTVYVAPDTIKLTDTIVNYLPDKQKIKSHNWSIGISFLPYISNTFNGKNVIDSISLKQKLNYSINLNLWHTKKGVTYGLNAGITPIREQLVSQYSSQAPLQSDQAIYDSLQINNICVADNYFNYINVNLFIGRKWQKMKMFYAIDASLLSNLLMDYKAHLPVNSTENKMPSFIIQKLNLGVALNPIIGYTTGKNWEFYLSLLYRYTLNKESKYPQSNLRYMDIAIGAGCNIIL